MTAEEFFSTVVVVNTNALMESPSDYRHAVNAILSADAFFGIFSLQHSEPDDVIRDRVSEEHETYALLRDTVFSLKHGQLLYKSPG
jgi:hypothetical protein